MNYLCKSCYISYKLMDWMAENFIANWFCCSYYLPKLQGDLQCVT